MVLNILIPPLIVIVEEHIEKGTVSGISNSIPFSITLVQTNNKAGD